MAARAMLLLRRLGPATARAQWAAKAPTLVGQSAPAAPVVRKRFFGPTRVIILDFRGFKSRRPLPDVIDMRGEKMESGGGRCSLSGHVGTFGVLETHTQFRLDARQLNYSIWCFAFCTVKVMPNYFSVRFFKKIIWIFVCSNFEFWVSDILLKSKLKNNI